MQTFNISLCLDDDESTIEEIVCDLDAAINDYGLLGGNFLVSNGPTKKEFWAEWERRIEREQ